MCGVAGNFTLQPPLAAACCLLLLLLLLLLLMLERPQWLPSPPSIVPSPIACSENEVSIRCMRGGCDASA